MAAPKEFKLSKHAFDRLLERDKEFNLLITKDMTPEMVHGLAYKYLNSSIEDKSFLNNTKFMVRIQEKYGYDPIFIFVKNKSIFVGYRKPTKNVIVTVLNRDMDTANHIRHKRIKYKSKETS